MEKHCDGQNAIFQGSLIKITWEKGELKNIKFCQEMFLDLTLWGNIWYYV